MVEDFPLIAVTVPDGCVAEEAHAICKLLRSGGFWRVHVRKERHIDAISLLEVIPVEFHERISLHNATAEDVRRFPQIGVHLTGKTPFAPNGFKGMVSKSCHSIDELAQCRNEGCDYAFLSPVFDSISKAGYHAAFTEEELVRAGKKGTLRHAFALGGVTFDKIDWLKSLGFRGAAMLSAAWTKE